MDLINLLNEIGGPQKCCIKIIEKNKSTKKTNLGFGELERKKTNFGCSTKKTNLGFG